MENGNCKKCIHCSAQKKSPWPKSNGGTVYCLDQKIWVDERNGENCQSFYDGGPIRPAPKRN